MRGFFVNKRFTLNRKERLKSRKRLEQLFREGKVVYQGCFRVHYLLRQHQDETGPQGGETPPLIQAAFGVSKSHFRKATDRNRIKRISREVYRMQKSAIQLSLQKSNKGIDLFISYIARDLPEFNAAYAQMQVLLERLEKITHGAH